MLVFCSILFLYTLSNQVYLKWYKPIPIPLFKIQKLNIAKNRDHVHMFYTDIFVNFLIEFNSPEVPLECDCTIESLKCNYYILNHTIFYPV